MMRFVTGLMLVSLLPGVALAQIRSSVSAAANTGGNVAGPGGRVETGDASASVNVTTRLSGRSSSSILIETSANGIERKEAYASEDKEVDVSVSATPAETKIEIREGGPSGMIKQETVRAIKQAVPIIAASTTAAAEVAAKAAEPPAPQNFLQAVFSWLGDLFGRL